MTTLKKNILFIHRWLGFISGLVVFIVSITGCIFCFQDEIQDALYDYRKVEVQQKPYAAPSVLKQIAIKRYPGSAVSYIYYYGKDRPAAALTDVPKQGLHYVFMNPYTGSITHTEAAQSNFFVVVEFIHLYLLLPPKIGQMVVGTSVLVFVALMITGVILWWPKRKSDRKRCFTIKWNGRWRRVNYDLHNVMGFYAISISLILAITGLSMSFEWVRDGIYRAGNLGRSYPSEKAYPQSDSLAQAKANYKPIDATFTYAQQHSPNAKMFLLNDPDTKAGPIGITAYGKSMHFGQSDIFYFDRYTTKLLNYLPNSKKSFGLKLNDMNYDIHVGQIAGLPGKILAFLASLICASLPITGLIIYMGKKKKPKSKVKSGIQHAIARKNIYYKAKPQL